MTKNKLLKVINMNSALSSASKYFFNYFSVAFFFYSQGNITIEHPPFINFIENINFFKFAGSLLFQLKDAVEPL